MKWAKEVLLLAVVVAEYGILVSAGLMLLRELARDVDSDMRSWNVLDLSRLAVIFVTGIVGALIALRLILRMGVGFDTALSWSLSAMIVAPVSGWATTYLSFAGIGLLSEGIPVRVSDRLPLWVVFVATSLLAAAIGAALPFAFILRYQPWRTP